jgi:DNA-binding response OmpR family regulator
MNSGSRWRKYAFTREEMEESTATILILEPDDNLREMMTQSLRGLGYRVIIASDWMDALSFFQEQRPELMLLDVVLPQMNGIDLLRYFKTQGWLKQTNVILISALGYPEILQKARTAGAKDFLVKPFEEDVFLGKVRSSLGEMDSN